MSDGGHYGMALKGGGEGGGASTLTAFEVSWRNQWWVAIKVGGVMEWSICKNMSHCTRVGVRVLSRDQREWVFEVREVKTENKKLSLFFEKCKVKKKCFHSFSRSAK